MGARVYLAKIGRFLQVDPQEGGNENNYVYPPDPVNSSDLDGNKGSNWNTAINIVTRIATIGSFIPGPIGMGFAAVAVASNLAQGHYAEAAVAAVGLIGLGAVALAAKSAISGYRAYKATQAASSLSSKLIFHEALTNGGRIAIKSSKIGDPRYRHLWSKREYVHVAGDGTHTTVHWMQQRFTKRVDQIKVKHVKFRYR